MRFEWLVPSKPQDRPRYLALRAQVLGVLTAGYGKAAFPASLHDMRMTHEDQHLCFATKHDGSERIVACSYVRSDGKRGATAVLPAFRSVRIGTRLILESLIRIPHQFGEVAIDNLRHAELLVACGFRYASSIEFVRATLRELAPLVTGHVISNGRVIYRRKSRDMPEAERDFFLLHTLQDDRPAG